MKDGIIHDGGSWYFLRINEERTPPCFSIIDSDWVHPEARFKEAKDKNRYKYCLPSEFIR